MYIIINFETDDLAERMIREEDEEYPSVPNEEHVLNLLREEGLNFSDLENSFAVMHNVNKKLFIQLEANNVVYQPSLLKRLELPLYVKYAHFFNSPKKVRIVDVSPQIGGIIDINYGIKFKIQVLDLSSKGIDVIDKNKYQYKDEEENRKESLIKMSQEYISTLFIDDNVKSILNEIGLKEENVTNKTIQTIVEMLPFYYEMDRNINKARDDIDDFKTIYKRNDLYYVGCHGEFFCIAFVGLFYVVYIVKDDRVYLLPIRHPDSLWKLSKALKEYIKRGAEKLF
jgi:hypothetical protein